uniref:hypothetical protein n=1 Tax=Nitrospira cf. moscoviensis SBR1015 TaxID=96242 RepID=UPI00117DE5E0|nr:hypothetical protein [Nitrospira cf. moscoviensis SBR1015]
MAMITAQLHKGSHFVKFQLSLTHFLIKGREMLMKKYLPILVAVCFSLLLTGCVFLERSVFSMPQAPEGKLSYSAESYYSTSTDTITVTHPELDITVFAHNRQTDLVLFGPALEIVILPIFPWPPGLFKQWFESPKPPLQMVVMITPKKEGFSFNPERVTLQTDWGKSLKPIDFEPRESTLAKGKDMVFTLKFDTSNRNFDLLLDGIEKNGKPFLIQKIQFKTGSDWKINGL